MENFNPLSKHESPGGLQSVVSTIGWWQIMRAIYTLLTFCVEKPLVRNLIGKDGNDPTYYNYFEYVFPNDKYGCDRMCIENYSMQFCK